MLTSPKSILILPPVGLGDFITALPLLKAIWRKWPQAQLILPEVYERNEPLVTAALGSHGIFRFAALDNLAEQPPEIAFLLTDDNALLSSHDAILQRIPIRIGHRKSVYRKRWLTHPIRASILGRPFHETLRYLRLLSAIAESPRPSSDDIKTAVTLNLKLLQTAQLPQLPDRFIVLHPFSAGSGRNWPTESFVELASVMIKSGYSVVITGSENEHRQLAACWLEEHRPAGMIDLSGKLNLEQLIYVIDKALALVAGSTGPLHVSAALGKPTIGLYPPRKGLNFKRWGAIGIEAVWVQRNQCEEGKCSNAECQCMRSISPELIANLLRSKLKGQTAHRIESTREISIVQCKTYDVK